MTVRVIHAQEKHHEMAAAFFRSRDIIANDADRRELAAVLAKIEDDGKEAMAQAVKRLAAGEATTGASGHDPSADPADEEIYRHGEQTRRDDHAAAADLGH